MENILKSSINKLDWKTLFIIRVFIDLKWRQIENSNQEYSYLKFNTLLVWQTIGCDWIHFSRQLTQQKGNITWIFCSHATLQFGVYKVEFIVDAIGLIYAAKHHLHLAPFLPMLRFAAYCFVCFSITFSIFLYCFLYYFFPFSSSTNSPEKLKHLFVVRIMMLFIRYLILLSVFHLLPKRHYDIDILFLGYLLWWLFLNLQLFHWK